jgi:type IV pilus assembly protein PilW
MINKRFIGQVKFMETRLQNIKGFTFVELLVVLSIAAIVSGGIYTAYKSQVGSYTVQQQVVEMQQNIRAAVNLMEREIRMAGYDPTGGAGAGIITARSDTLEFTMDARGGDADKLDNDHDGTVDEADEVEFGDGHTNDTDEQIRYALDNDTDNNGIADGSPCRLGRETGGGGGLQPVAENVDALNFVYLDEDGNNLIDTDLNPPAVPAADISEIRSIQITIVARSGQSDSGFFNKYTDNESYENQEGEEILSPQNDHIRRMLLTAEIKCRNLGLN